MKKLRVAAYCRVSTDQDDQRNSLQSQRRYFDDYMRSQENWESVGVFADEGITGTSTRKRRAFHRMIALAERGEIDLILTKEVSRFARNTVDTLEITRRLKERGVGVLFLVDNIDTRENDGEFRLSIMASVAQEESRKTSERVRWGQRRQMERGVVFGNNSIYGFDLKGGRLTIREDEAEVVRHIFHKFAVEGKGTHVIARELSEEGIAPPRTATGIWSSTMVLRILRNEKFAGDLLQKKHITKNYLTHKKTLNDGSEEPVYIRAHHEAVVERALFEHAQAELARRAPSAEQRTRYSNRYWCSGRIQCGGCGSRFILRVSRRENCAEYRAWVCRARAHEGHRKRDAQGRPTGCDMRIVSDQTLQACMQYLMRALDVDTDRIARHLAAAIRSQGGGRDGAAEIGTLQARRAQTLGKQEAAMDAFLSGVLTREELERMQARYRGELAAIDRKIVGLEEQQEKTRAAQGGAEPLAVRLREQAVASQAVWRELVERITVCEDRLRIKLYAFPRAFDLRYTTSGRGGNVVTTVIRCDMEDDA